MIGNSASSFSHSNSTIPNRVTFEEAEQLYRNASLGELAERAMQRRSLLVPASQVSFLIDRNINYTNVCNSDCSFCGFYRHDPNHPDSYVLSEAQIRQKIEEALDLGATRILLQGGHNDQLPYSYYVHLVRWLREQYAIDLNCFSPSEIHQMHLISGKSYAAILQELSDAGLSGLPGGGAEILDDEIRARVSPKKIRSAVWLDIMRIAHELRLTTTATMVIGFGEGVRHRLNHLFRLRELQDEAITKRSEGFNAFISWTLQHNENTSLGRSRHRKSYGADSVAYLRNVAMARIVLDNIPHHAASWPTLGTEVGKIALHFGCDDFGSTMMEENVVSKAGALTQSKWSMSPAEIIETIHDAGFDAVERTATYQLRRSYPRLEEATAITRINN